MECCCWCCTWQYFLLSMGWGGKKMEVKTWDQTGDPPKVLWVKCQMCESGAVDAKATTAESVRLQTQNQFLLNSSLQRFSRHVSPSYRDSLSGSPRLISCRILCSLNFTIVSSEDAWEHVFYSMGRKREECEFMWNCCLCSLTIWA